MSCEMTFIVVVVVVVVGVGILVDDSIAGGVFKIPVIQFLVYANSSLNFIPRLRSQVHSER